MMIVVKVLLVGLVGGQYLESSEKYSEELSAAKISLTAGLYEEIEEIDLNVYVHKEPHPQLYAIGLIVEPCANRSADCCEGRFGSPTYGRVKQELVDFGLYSTGTENFHRLLADADEVLANVDLVDAQGGDLDSDESRLADDEIFLADECSGVRQGLDSIESGLLPYVLEPSGELRKATAYTHCQGSRLGHRSFSLKPPCHDNNRTVNASSQRMQVAFTQTSIIVNCGKSGSRNGQDFSENEHCGTYLEIHRENGSPYDNEDFIISSQRIETKLTSGYSSTYISLEYGENNETKRILCDYQESSIRLGSMVFITADSPDCCCAPEYNNDDRTGLFYCPQNAYDATAGPFAKSLSSLDHMLSFNTSVDNYPYCSPTYDRDVLMCSANDTSTFGIPRVYAKECPSLAASNTHSTSYQSPYLIGTSYTSKCFFYEGCAGNPIRTGDYADLTATSDIDAATNQGCAFECLDSSDCKADSYFSFKGQVGKVTCVPTDTDPCVNLAEDRFDDDEMYYLVTFNDNRTSYPFRFTDLVLHQPRANYQLWWVQRTRHNFIIQKKKNFRVSEPTCTFDSVNDRYFPYTIINKDDGSYIDTY